jgi:hypothetical protein
MWAGYRPMAFHPEDGSAYARVEVASGKVPDCADAEAGPGVSPGTPSAASPVRGATIPRPQVAARWPKRGA